MSRLSAEDARNEWRGDGQVLAREVAARLIAGEPLDGLGLGEVEGRTDLRGLWVVNPMKYLPAGRSPGAPVSGDVTLWAADVHWRDIDLSHTTLPLCLWRARVERVRLDYAGLQSWRVLESRLEDVSLFGADLDQAALDGNNGLQGHPVQWSPSTWDRCDFNQARLANSPGFGRAVLTDCTFVETVWPRGTQGFDFYGTSLRRCRFEGISLDLHFGWTGDLRGETPPWVEVLIPANQVSDCYVNQASGPGIVTV